MSVFQIILLKHKNNYKPSFFFVNVETEKKSLLERYVEHFLDGSSYEHLMIRYDNYLKELKSSSQNTRRAYNGDIYDYLRFLFFSRWDFHSDYFPVWGCLSMLHALDLEDQKSAVLPAEKNRRQLIKSDSLLKEAIERTENKDYLLPAEKKPTERQLTRARNLLGPDFNFSLRGEQPMIQLRKVSPSPRLVDIRKEDRMIIDFLCYQFDPGPPDCRYSDEELVLMDTDFWNAVFHKRRQGTYKDAQKQNGNAGSTIGRKASAINKFQKFLDEEEGLLTIPKKMSRPVYHEPLRIDISAEELEKIYQKIKIECRQNEGVDRLNAIRNKSEYSMLCSTGMRVGALCGLQIHQVDLENRVIFVTEKGGKRKVYDLLGRAFPDLKEWIEVRCEYIQLQGIEDKGYVYYTERGNPMHQKSLSRMVCDKAREAGIVKTIGGRGGISAHDLRGAVAARMYENGADLLEMKEFLGHKDITTTMRYIGRAKIDLKKVIRTTNPFVRGTSN